MLQQYEPAVLSSEAGNCLSAMANGKFHGSSPFFVADGSPLYHYTSKGLSTGDAGRIDAANDARPGPEPVPSHSARLSDTHLASRKANETARRRYQAADWLHTMVGPLDLALEPTEEELRLCLRNGLVLCNLINKIHPGAVPKIVENPTLSSLPPEGAALSAYQYFENVRNFLVAVEELKLPSFEASDLEKGSLQAGLLAKVVDCILALKAYHEWQQSGGQGGLKFGAPIKYPWPTKSSAKALNGSHKFTEPLALSSSKLNRPDELWASHGHGEKHEQLNGLWKGHCLNDLLEETEHAWSSFDANAAAWVQHVCQKFVDVFFSRIHNSHDTSMPCESLLKLVMVVLDDRTPEEVPMLVEFMLKKVIEECEQRLCSREGQKRSHSKIMEDLSDLNNCPQNQDKVQGLLRELQQMHSVDEHRALCLEMQSNELKELKCELENTRLDFQDMQYGWERELEGLNRRLQGLAQAAAEYHKVAAENRELYNQVQDLKGNIRVYCRVRPFLKGQTNRQSTVDFIGERGSIVISNPAKQGKEHRKAFNFNKVFGPSCAQEEVFLDTQPLIRSVLDGFNVCIFAYGQTGSGKTYTMTGPNNPSPEDWGVNFRALHDLFQISQSRKDLIKYEVGVQMIEIYNEQVRDLLCTDGSNKKLEIRNNSQQNGLNVPDANMVPVNSTEDVLHLMTLGHRNRAVGATALNDRSSRSHSVLTVHVKGADQATGAVLRGCLHLVDLAGSERVDKSEATGDRLKEAQHINKSLSALGDVIAALAQKSSHVPYRNSKLTQLLQDSLGGQAKTLMFVHISPDEESYGETISTLKFAERVAVVELGAAQSNKESGEVRDLKDQITFLKDALAKKDGELERVIKESRAAKSLESTHEKVKTRSPSHFGAGAHHGHGLKRQPLEEVRNAEGRHVPSSDYRSGHSSEAHSPDASSGFYGFSEEDVIRRRPRQAMSPDSRSSNSNSEVSFHPTPPPPSARGSNKNKIRHGSPEDRERVQLNDRVRATTSLTVQSNAHQSPPPHVNGMDASRFDSDRSDSGDRRSDRQGGGPLRLLQNGHSKHAENGLLSIKHAERKAKEPKMSPLFSAHHHLHTPPTVPYSAAAAAAGGGAAHHAPPRSQVSRRDAPQQKRSFHVSREADSGEYSTGESTGRMEDFEEESDYSEAEVVWHNSKDTDAGPLHLLEHGKVLLPNGVMRNSDAERRYMHQQQAAPLASKTDGKDVASPADGQAHRRSRSHSLVGSTPFGMDFKRPSQGAKANLDAKLIPVPDERGGFVEFPEKATTHPRQPHGNGHVPRRWH